MSNEELATFIEQNVVGDGRTRIGETTELIEEGIIDSMGLMQIVTYIESQTGLRVSDDDVTPENFETVAAIGQLVERLDKRRQGR